MGPIIAALTTEAELRRFIVELLCRKDHLDPSQIPVCRCLLRRNGRICGALYHIEGPRLLRTSAVWTGEESRILFYDSQGVRFHEVRLSDSPDPSGIKEEE